MVSLLGGNWRQRNVTVRKKRGRGEMTTRGLGVSLREDSHQMSNGRKVKRVVWSVAEEPCLSLNNSVHQLIRLFPNRKKKPLQKIKHSPMGHTVVKRD